MKLGKNKMIAVLLAVLCSCFGWLYTYKKNNRKFWVGSVLSGLPILLAALLMVFFVSTGEWFDQLIIFMAYAFPISVWIWAIVDNLSKGSDWYEAY